MDRMKLLAAKDRFERLAEAFGKTSLEELTADQLAELHAAIADVQAALGVDEDGEEVERAIAE
jgi:hypothetical protein